MGELRTACPDVMIELSLRHPQWEFTRSNDFHDRRALAFQHGYEVEAMVMSETFNWTSRNISGPASKYPDVQSTWMSQDYFGFRTLAQSPGFKPNRYICQNGRWLTFLFMKSSVVSSLNVQN